MSKSAHVIIAFPFQDLGFDATRNVKIFLIKSNFLLQKYKNAFAVNHSKPALKHTLLYGLLALNGP